LDLFENSKQGFTMGYKFIELKKFGGPEVLEIAQRDVKPDPQKGEVRVKVLATSAAFTDTLIRRGIYPDIKEKPPITPGYDMVGVIDKLGEEVTEFKEGDRVAELTIIGAYSEYMIFPANQLVQVPDKIDPAEAVSLILSYITAYQMLVRSANINPGQSILIHGAGGAVGNALLQLGSILNLKMYGTASTSQHDVLRKFDCIPIDYKNEDFVQKIKELEPNGVNAVFDPIGGENFKRSLKTVTKNGRLVAFGSYNASSGIRLIVDFMRVKMWNLTPWIPSTSFYSIGAWHKKHHDWFRDDLIKLFDWYMEGKISPSIEKKMKLTEASLAHELIDSGKARGKIVLLANQ
jgi:NADPH2:quinone reductase